MIAILCYVFLMPLGTVILIDSSLPAVKAITVALQLDTALCLQGNHVSIMYFKGNVVIVAWDDCSVIHKI